MEMAIEDHMRDVGSVGNSLGQSLYSVALSVGDAALGMPEPNLEPVVDLHGGLIPTQEIDVWSLDLHTPENVMTGCLNE